VKLIPGRRPIFCTPNTTGTGDKAPPVGVIGVANNSSLALGRLVLLLPFNYLHCDIDKRPAKAVSWETFLRPDLSCHDVLAGD
jgi:hypothetical protein